MSELLGMSFDAPANPEVSFERTVLHADASSGWGLAWYPAGQLTAAVVRDPYSGGSAGIAQILQDWDRFRTNVLVGHLRSAAKRTSYRDTQPFVRLWGGRSWVFAHDGDLGGPLTTGLPLPPDPQFVPGGQTDTEHLFAWILSRAHDRGATSLADLGHEHLGELFGFANRLGTLNVLLSDGEDLVAYRDISGHRSLHWTMRVPPHDDQPLGAAGITARLSARDDVDRTMVVVCSVPLSDEGWHELSPGQTLIVRRGEVTDTLQRSLRVAAPPSEQPGKTVMEPSERGTAGRRFSVLHETRYRYDQPVERSSHRFRLGPVDDRFQRIIGHEVEINCDGSRFTFDDVFGNRVVGLEIHVPFQELVVTARSEIELHEIVDRPDLLPERHSLPLVWMPWQHQMMSPYLLPSELPENELRELGAFAADIAERNGGDLLATLSDLTETIHRDFAYTPGFTTVETTPYEVFVTRAGVCQDFANLMVCACRLLQIPARYRVGYIYTAADYANTIQSDASHAWVEVYIPHVGWRGYDPTNGSAVGTDHIRVAAGRNYRDATSTTGVILRGGGGERLSLSVQVEELPTEPPPEPGRLRLLPG